MKPQIKDPLFNSLELNKIFPSYLFDEIDEEQKDLNNYNVDNKHYDFVLHKENNKVSKND